MSGTRSPMFFDEELMQLFYRSRAGGYFRVTLPTFSGSGAGHQGGLVPDPGSTAGATRYLCEDGTWSTPSGGGGGGSSDHALLTHLSWTVSGHTGTANTFAVFDGSGAAALASLPLAVANGGTGATTAAGARPNLGLVIGTDVQAWDADLDALAALGATAGMLSRTGAGAWAVRTLTAPAAGITISNPTGAAGNPTWALANDLAAVEGLGGTGLAARTAADTWTTRTLQPPAAGITISNPAGVAGDPTFALANDLAALEALGTTGLGARTAADTWTTRTVAVAGTGIAIVNGDGVAGDPTITITPTSVVVAGSPLTTKGDIVVYTSTTTRKGVSGSRGAGLRENPDNADGLEWVSAPSAYYGDGFDGNATIAAGTTTLTVPKSYGDLTVNGTLVAAGFSVQVRGTLTFGAAGVIAYNGNSAVANTGGAAPAGGSQFGVGVAGANGVSGANGGNGTQATNAWPALRGAASAGKGGNGGATTGHTGGTGTTPAAPAAGQSGINQIAYDTGSTIGNNATPLALKGGSGGAAGGADGTSISGGGGAGGNVVGVKAWIVDATAGGLISADGGNGGNGTANGGTGGGGGGGGGGGHAWLHYGHAVSGTLPTVRAAGGTKGTGVGTGANGTDGTAGSTEVRRILV